MATIDYYFSLMSPFTYLAGDGLERIAARHGAAIRYRPADFQAIFRATGGVAVSDRHPTRQSYRLQELRRLPKVAGMPLNIQPKFWPVDPALSSAMVIATEADGGDAGSLACAFLRAVWAEERDISDREVVAEILRTQGHDSEPLLLREAEGRDVYETNTRTAIAAEVFGAPTYVVGEERFWGQDRLTYLDWHLSQ